MSLLRPGHAPEARAASLAERIASQRSSRTRSGPAVGPDTAMRLSAFWACVNLISDLVSTLPAGSYRRRTDVREGIAP